MRARAMTLVVLLAGCTNGETLLEPPTPADGGRVEPCGDGVIGPSEVCDPNAPPPLSCADFGFPGGTLGCNARCAGFLVGACEGMPVWAEGFGDEARICAAGDRHDGEGCVPCSSNPLSSSLVLDLAIETTTVTGRVTIAGNAPPQDHPFRGAVRVEHTSSAYHARAVRHAIEVPISPTGPTDTATFSVPLLPGSYRALVRLSGDDLPAGAFEVASFDVPATSSLDLDLPAPVPVSVTVEAPVGAPRIRSIRLQPVNGTSDESIAIDETGAGVGPVYPGRYRPYTWSRALTGCDYRWPEVTIGGPTALVLTVDAHPVRVHVVDHGTPTDDFRLRLQGPCGSANLTRPELAQDLVLYAGSYRIRVMDGAGPDVEFEVPGTDEVTVEIRRGRSRTLTGRVRDDLPYARLVAESGRLTGSTPIVNGAFTLEAPAGSYRLEVGPVPDHAELFVAQQIDLIEDTAVDIAVPPDSDLSGNITALGASPTADRFWLPAWLAFDCTSGCVGTATIAVADDGTYHASIPAGTYEVSLVPDHPPLVDGYERVRRRYRLGPPLTVGPRSQVRDFDMKTITIEGESVVRGTVELREWKRGIGRLAWASKDLGVEPRFVFETFPGPQVLGVRLADVESTTFWTNREFPFDLAEDRTVRLEVPVSRVSIPGHPGGLVDLFSPWQFVRVDASQGPIELDVLADDATLFFTIGDELEGRSMLLREGCPIPYR